MTPSSRVASSILDGLIDLGLREIVLAPGSRNAPLLFAAHDTAAAGRVRLHTRIDERSAGFLALGLSKVGSPAAVICTSGTAVANLHPAVLEAAHAGVGLILITADRPSELRGTSANQTTDQVGIFGPLVATVDVPVGARPDRWPDSPLRGPWHLNVQFAPPLVPEDEPTADEGLPTGGPPPPIGHPRQAAGPNGRPLVPKVIQSGPRTVVVAGDDAGPPARVLAQDARWPLLAEPTSGSRTGDNVIRCYRLLLDGALGARVERVVVAGHPTLSRPVTRLLERDDVEVLSMPAGGIWAERPFAVSETLAQPIEVSQPDDPDWLEEWRAADRTVSRALDRLLADESELTPYAVAGAVSRALPPDGMLFVGASSPIRDLDLMVARYAVGDRRKVIANRGLSGIDGTVSSAIGAALGRDSSRSLALLGDVTFLHDSNGLILGPGEAEPDLTIVVVNDDGGSIFAMLEQGAPAYAGRYERLFGTPHGVDLASLCAATRTPHWRVTSLAELEHALANPNGGIEIIEARVRRDNRRDLDERIRRLGR